MGRGTAGQIEGDHPLCFVQSAEPLGTPVASVVGGLVANFEAHWSFVVDVCIVADRGSDPKDQISNGVGVSIGTTPADRFALSGDHPDHALLSPLLSDAVGMVNVGRPIATVGIEGSPGDRLNGEGHCGSFELKSL